MSVDLAKHPIPNWLGPWIDEHYRFDLKSLVCRRCNMAVWAVTKHAVNVHGDDIPIVPPTPLHVAQGLSSDWAGRLVHA